MLCSNIICTLLVLILVGHYFAFTCKGKGSSQQTCQTTKDLHCYLNAFTANETRRISSSWSYLKLFRY